MWKPWAVAGMVASRSHERAVANARAASTELSRLRVERLEIEMYVAQRAARKRAPRAEQPA